MPVVFDMFGYKFYNPRLSDYDISNSDVSKIEKSILANRDRIIARWISHFIGFDIEFMVETK
jgi:hypothetical protein